MMKGKNNRCYRRTPGALFQDRVGSEKVRKEEDTSAEMWLAVQRQGRGFPSGRTSKAWVEKPLVQSPVVGVYTPRRTAPNEAGRREGSAPRVPRSQVSSVSLAFNLREWKVMEMFSTRALLQTWFSSGTPAIMWHGAGGKHDLGMTDEKTCSSSR